MSRRIGVALYDQIVALRPEWHSDDDAAGTTKVVMTGSAADPQGWQPHIGTKARRDLLAKRVKDPKDELKLVIVRDMWLTGFDAPSMHTITGGVAQKWHRVSRRTFPAVRRITIRWKLDLILLNPPNHTSSIPAAGVNFA